MRVVFEERIDCGLLSLALVSVRAKAVTVVVSPIPLPGHPQPRVQNKMGPTGHL